MVRKKLSKNGKSVRLTHFGKAVKVTLENEIIFGTTDGLTETGALRVKTDSGEIKIIQAGDVESLRKAV